MSLSRCLISTRRSSSLKTRIGSKRMAKLCRMRRTIFLSAAVMDCALFRVRSWERGGSAFDSDPTSVWAAVIRCMRCCSTPTRGSCFLLWGFHLVQSEPRQWWRSRQNTWLGKIRSDWDCSASAETPSVSSGGCFRSVQLGKFTFRAVIRSGERNSARKVRNCSVSAFTAWIIPSKPCAAWMWC